MRSFPGVLALLLASALHANILVGPPQPLTADTNAQAHQGGAVGIAANANGYLAIWRSGDSRTMGTRFDANGARLDGNGLPFTTASAFYTGAVASSGSGWDAIGFWIRPGNASGIYGFHVDENGRATDPVPIATDIYYAWSLKLTFNGSNYLATWVTQTSMTQTLSGAIVDRSLHLVRGPFDIATRDLDKTVQYSAAGPYLSNDVASDGSGFLIAWEQMLVDDLVLVPVTGSGDVLPAGVTHFDARVLSPSVTMTAAGYAVAWHDGQRIHAAFASVAGALTSADRLVADAGVPVKQLSLRSNEGGPAISYVAQQGPGCGDYTPVSATVMFQRLDLSLAAAGAPLVIGPDDVNIGLAMAGTGNSFVAIWSQWDCGVDAKTEAASVVGSSAGARQSISDFLTPAQQSTPAVASDGGSAVVVWSEQRVGDAAPQIYAMRAGTHALGNPITSGSAQHSNPRIAFDGRRYLAVWWNSGDGTIEGRFLDREGVPASDTIAIGAGGTPNLDVVWTGSEYVAAWTSDGQVRAARISASGETLSVSAAGNYPMTGAIVLAAGPGEAVALFEAKNSTSYLVESAVIRERISVAGTIAANKYAGCVSKCEMGAKPVAIAWSGHVYLAITMNVHHPAYGYDVYATPLVIGGQPFSTGARPVRHSYSPAGSATSGALAWTGADFVLVLPADAASLPKFWLARLDATGALEPGDTYVSDGGELAPSIAPVGPMRFLLVYANGRVLTRTVDLASMRRRATLR